MKPSMRAFQRRLSLLLIVPALLSGCIASGPGNADVADQIWNRLSPTEQDELVRASPVRLLEIYFEAFNSGNKDLMLACYSRDYLVTEDPETLYSISLHFWPGRAENLVITPYTPPFPKENEVCLEAEFEYVDSRGLMGTTGEARFFTVAKAKDGRWVLKYPPGTCP